MKILASLLLVAGVWFNSLAWAGVTSGYVGIGITLAKSKKNVVVERVLPKGPAELAGVLPSFILLSVDGHPATGKSLSEVSKWIRGTGVEGSIVQTEFLEPKSQSSLKLEIRRAYIEVTCAVEGWVRLQLLGSQYGGSISGWVGDLNAQMSYSGSIVSGTIGNIPVHLYLDLASINQFRIWGSINQTSVNWNGSVGSINQFQNCIPE